MLIRNVCYQEMPERFEVRRHGGKMATVLFPTEIIETEDPEGNTQYLAKKVYVLETGWTQGIEERISGRFDAWLAKAKEPQEAATTLDDLVEAINTLTDIVMGV